MQNPFAPQLLSSSVPSGGAPGLTRGLSGSARADMIRTASQDIGSRDARIQQVKMSSAKIKQELKNNPQSGSSSRIAYLARQLDKDF